MKLASWGKSIGGLLLLFVVLITCAPAQERESERERERERRERSQQKGQKSTPREMPAYVSAEHQAVLQRWLAREPDLRVATDVDCGKCTEEVAYQSKASGMDYHPYYTVGDFNGDGKKDFAVALIEVEPEEEGRAKIKFAVAVFNAPFSRRKVEPTFFKDNLNLRDGGLFFGAPRPRPYRLYIGVFANDDGLTLIPSGRKYVAQ